METESRERSLWISSGEALTADSDRDVVQKVTNRQASQELRGKKHVSSRADQFQPDHPLRILTISE